MKKKLTIVLSVRVLEMYIYATSTHIGLLCSYMHIRHAYSCCPLAWNTNNLHGSMVSSSLGAHTHTHTHTRTRTHNNIYIYTYIYKLTRYIYIYIRARLSHIHYTLARVCILYDRASRCFSRPGT